VCGHCRNCRAGRRHLCRNTKGIGVNRDGAFAEFVSVPASNAYVLPPGMPDEIGSCLDPLGNAQCSKDWTHELKPRVSLPGSDVVEAHRVALG